MTIIGQSPLTAPFYSTIPINRVTENRAPTLGDWQNYVLGDEWLDTSSNDWWKLVSLAGNQGLWIIIGGTNAAIETLTGDTGGAVPPDASNNLNILGGDTTTVTGNPATNTLTIDASTSGYPITKYVVGPVGEAGYQTIQSALDAANAAGGGAVWVKPEGSPYNENLTLYDKTQVIGAIAPGDTLDLVINGVHTPPDTGSFMFRNIWFQSATDIFNSIAAGSADLFIIDSVLQITNGFTFNLIDWTGTCVVFNCGDQSTNNGHIQNTGGATAFFTNASIGKGVVNTMVTSGVTELYNVIVDCPVDFQTGATGVISGGSRFKTNVTFSNDSSLNVTNSFFDTGAAQAITYNSSANSNFSEITINSSNSPAIGGTGAGNFNIGSISFLNDASIASTVVVTSGQSRSGELLTEKPLSGAAVTSTTSNLSDTASSDAQSIVQVAGTSAGDPIRSLIVTGGVTFNDYLDNSDTDSFKEDIVGLGTVRKIFSTKGERLLPFQPITLSNVTMDQPNATGAGTRYDIICDAEDVDIGNNYNTTTGIYTVPETGFLFFLVRIYFSNVTALMTTGRLGLIINGSASPTPGPNVILPNPGVNRNPSNEFQYEFSYINQFTKGDTIQPFTTLTGGAGDTATVRTAGTSFGIFLNQ
jgi:hypothetical protein